MPSSPTRPNFAGSPISADAAPVLERFGVDEFSIMLTFRCTISVYQISLCGGVVIISAIALLITGFATG